MVRSARLRRCGFALAALALALIPLTATAKEPSSTPHPSVRIPVGPLGFTPPAALYQPYRIPESSLGFLDENHLLFTFHVAKLMRRVPDDPVSDLDQTIHAIVLDLPGGKVAAQTDWRLHDRDHYVWMLGDGTFLLRERDSFYVGDASLTLHLYAQPIGTFMYGQMAPGASTFEAEYVNQVPDQDLGAPSTAPSLLGGGIPLPHVKQQYTMLIVNTHDHDTKRVNDLYSPIVLPIVHGGYVTVEQARGHDWDLTFNPWNAAPHTVAKVSSSCRPQLEPISEDVVLTVDCLPYSSDHLIETYDLEGHLLWHQMWQSRFIWGSFAFSRNGNRFAYGSLEVDHELGTLDPVEDSSILGQPVGVFETQTGKLDMVLGATPYMTAGDNFALSPSGSKFAIIRDGAIEIYDLPPVESPTAAKSK
jgi:hypothetical protein